MPKYYTCSQVADLYLVKPLTVWDWIRKKKLNAKKVGKRYLISEEDIQQFENQSEKNEKKG